MSLAFIVPEILSTLKFRDGRTVGRTDGRTDGRRTPEGQYIRLTSLTRESKNQVGNNPRIFRSVTFSSLFVSLPMSLWLSAVVGACHRCPVMPILMGLHSKGAFFAVRAARPSPAVLGCSRRQVRRSAVSGGNRLFPAAG